MKPGKFLECIGFGDMQVEQDLDLQFWRDPFLNELWCCAIDTVYHPAQIIPMDLEVQWEEMERHELR